MASNEDKVFLVFALGVLGTIGAIMLANRDKLPQLPAPFVAFGKTYNNKRGGGYGYTKFSTRS